MQFLRSLTFCNFSVLSAGSVVENSGRSELEYQVEYLSGTRVSINRVRVHTRLMDTLRLLDFLTSIKNQVIKYVIVLVLAFFEDKAFHISYMSDRNFT